MEKIIAYYRVSTAKQKRSGLGLEAQKDMIKTFAEANECEILGEFEEVETGRGSDALERRPLLAEAMKLAIEYDCYIAVARLDRLSRSVHFISWLMEKHFKFVVCEYGFQADPFVLHIFASVAEQERKLISERTIAGLKAAKARGKKLGAPKDILKDAQKKGNLTMMQVADEFADNMFPIIKALLEQHNNLSAVADELNNSKTPTSRNRTWQARQVAAIYKRVTGKAYRVPLKKKKKKKKVYRIRLLSKNKSNVKKQVEFSK